MEQAIVTFIINGKTYSLRASDGEAIREIPSADRQQLIALLEAVKLQETLSHRAVQNAAQKAVDKTRIASQAATNGAKAGDTTERQDIKPERLGSGDIDALMSRLIMEEKRDKKPGLTTQGLVKWVAGLAAIIILLVLIF